MFALDLKLQKMDRLNNYRKLIREIITNHTTVSYKHGDIKFETVFDSESDRYLLMILGRENKPWQNTGTACP